jgi:cholesterol oxidase
MSEDQPTAAEPTSVRFTEQMKGFVTQDAADPRVGYEAAKERDEKFMFELTVTAPDIDEFVADPTHAGTAEGFVEAEIVDGRSAVEQGWVNLFTGAGDGAKDRRMLYRLWLSSAQGEAVTVMGVKEVHDDPGFDIWDDTTTLFVQVLEGHIPPGDAAVESGHLPHDDPRVRGAGILRILPLDFAKQMTTFRSTGPGGAGAIARFGILFFGEVWGTYARLAVQDES